MEVVVLAFAPVFAAGFAVQQVYGNNRANSREGEIRMRESQKQVRNRRTIAHSGFPASILRRITSIGTAEIRGRRDF